MIVWLISMTATTEERQYSIALIKHNQPRISNLVEIYGLDIDIQNSQFVDNSFLSRTIVGQRRSLADLLRLQSYGFSWMATGIDQYIPEDYNPVRNNLGDDLAWNEDFPEPIELSLDDFRFDILSTAIQRTTPIPILLVNEPIFIADGLNSDLHYNSAYPRWVYNQYRGFFAQIALENGWNYLDLWDSIDAGEFTNTALHYSPRGANQLAASLYPYILEIARD
jgi:hypothetical protein